MQIDMHTHVLALAIDPEFTVGYGREGSLCIFRSAGSVPTHRMPTEEEWEASGFSRKGWPVIGGTESKRDHPGFDKIVLLSVSPQWLDGRLIGTVDPTGVTGVDGPPDPEKCNDYIAGLVSQDPETLVGFASVNPAYKGPQAAVEELTRGIRELGLSGVKLYPMYQHWSPDDRDLAFPVYQCALDLGIPVMFHQAGSTRIDASLRLGRPALLDDVGREFRDLTVIIAHMGIPWQDEALFLLRTRLCSCSPSGAQLSGAVLLLAQGRALLRAPTSELLRRALLSHRGAQLSGAVLLLAQGRALLRAPREAVLRLGLSRILVRPGGPAGEAPDAQRPCGTSGTRSHPAAQAGGHHG